MFDRPKHGFNLAISFWLRGPLRDRAEELLSPSRLSGQGPLYPKRVQARWHEHLSGQCDRACAFSGWWVAREGSALWAVLMFEAWLDVDNETASPTVTSLQLPVCDDDFLIALGESPREWKRAG